MGGVKINSFELENVKRIKAVKLEPSENGLTIIGGKNRQGKTTVLDSIAWALGGNKFKPSQATREGSVLPPKLKVTLSNGLIVERDGKNSDLKVTDPSGQKAGQRLLDSFISELALDLPRFLNSSSKDKARTLLEIIGVEEELRELEDKENKLYQERLATGQMEKRKKHSAEEMEYFPEVEGDSPLSVSDLIQQQQEILARNGKNQELRNNLENMQHAQRMDLEELENLKERIKELEEKQKEISLRVEERAVQIESSSKSVEELQDESTAEIEASIENIEELNSKIAINLKKTEALKEAEDLKLEYESLSDELEEVRRAKTDLLQGADLPLPDLGIEEDELTYKGFKWDGMSGTERLKVATAIVRKLQPECGFVLVDELEKFDSEELEKFARWTEEEGLQIIATRVSDGDECTIIISDGYAYAEEKKEEVKEIKEEVPSWKNASWK